MDHPNAPPSKPLVWAARCLKALLWLAVSGWVLFGATLGVVHGIIVPRIGNWRADLETLATKAVGIPVRIGEIRAHSKGLIPLFEFSDVRLLDKSGRDALQLGRVLTSAGVMRGPGGRGLAASSKAPDRSSWKPWSAAVRAASSVREAFGKSLHPVADQDLSARYGVLRQGLQW